MQNNKNLPPFNPLLSIVNELLKNSSSRLEKDFLHNVGCNPLLGQQKFPVSDTYVYYVKNEEGKATEEVEKISLKVYLAGYTKDNVEVSEDPTNNSIIVSGEISENEHFPKADNVKRYTQGASSKKFKVRYSMFPKFKLDNASMNDGVLSIDFTPTEDFKVKKINIT